MNTSDRIIRSRIERAAKGCQRLNFDIVRVTEVIAHNELQSRLAGADLEVTSASGAKFPEETADTIAARLEVELATSHWRSRS